MFCQLLIHADSIPVPLGFRAKDLLRPRVLVSSSSPDRSLPNGEALGLSETLGAFVGGVLVAETASWRRDAEATAGCGGWGGGCFSHLVFEDVFF